MTKKVLPVFVLITLAACLLSYKFGSVPVARAGEQTLPAAPATWTLTAYEASANKAATASRPAGGAGVQHVATCISFSFQVSPGTQYGGSYLYLRDGASGTGNVLWQLLPGELPGANITQSVCDLNIVGSPNTPMTLEFANGANAGEALNLVGYDAQ